MQAPFSEFWWTIGIGTVTLVVLAVAFVAALVANQRRFIESQNKQLDDLRRSEEKYRNLFENSLVGMVRFALGDLRILDCNRTACEVFGGSRLEDVQGGLAGLDQSRRSAFVRFLKEHGSVEEFEAELPQQGRWISITCQAHVGGGYAEGVILDITQRKRAEAQLLESHQQLRNLSSRLESVREEERVRIARQVHDELGQILTAVKIHLSLLTTKTGEGRQPTRLPRKLDALVKIIDDAIDLVKNISNDLRPLALEESGLKEAIEWEAAQFEQKTGIRCHVFSTNGDLRMRQESSTAVFRIFQEALTNVVRHAQAQSVRITLTQTETDFSMEIADDGRGITEAEASNPKALGILGMRERASFLGGSLSVRQANDQGTVVGLIMPRQG